MITIHENLCVRCGACANICMCGNISMSQEGPVAKNAVCIECGHCTAVCPENAIEVNGYDASDVEPYRPNILDAQTLLQAIRQRRSMRRFTDQKVSRAQIEQLIQAGRFSASAKNRQDVRYIVLDADAQEVRRMAWDSLGIFGKKMAIPISPGAAAGINPAVSSAICSCLAASR